MAIIMAETCISCSRYIRSLCTCVCMCVCVYIYIYTHTHMHLLVSSPYRISLSTVMVLFKNENSQCFLQPRSAMSSLLRSWGWFWLSCWRLLLRFDVTVPHTRAPSPSVINARSCRLLQIVAESLCRYPVCLRPHRCATSGYKRYGDTPQDCEWRSCGYSCSFRHVSYRRSSI